MRADTVDVLAALAGAFVAYVAVACARAWMARTADLNISIFRPWRGDPWPVGVQEDDDFRFQWSAAASGTAIAGPPIGRDSSDGPDDVSDIDDASGRYLDTVAEGPVSVEPVGRINVRRIGS